MFTFDTEIRTQHGTGASRRLRLQNQVPAVIYGGEEPPVTIALNRDKVNNAAVNPDFYRKEVALNVDGRKIIVKVKAVQHDPVKPKLQHIDFLRV